jgi:L-2-hydroxyglutarate oxidase LhgO
MIHYHATFGWCLVGAGVLGVVTGVVLIWVRSRWPDDPA